MPSCRQSNKQRQSEVLKYSFNLHETHSVILCLALYKHLDCGLCGAPSDNVKVVECSSEVAYLPELSVSRDYTVSNARITTE
jgi:hypothetical protein